MKLPRRSALTFLLALLSSTGPLSLDMYLPSLPDIGRSLEASTLQVQLTISSYLFGSAIGQIFYGPISDRYGRRSPLLAALLLSAFATFGCAAAQSIGTLVALRFVQAIGVAGVMVMARAMVRDIYSGAHASRELSMMGAVSGFVPVIAPVIGGALQIWFGWRASFALLVLFGAVMGLLVASRLPETLRHRTKMPFSLLEMSAVYRSVAAHQGFLANLAILTVGLAGLFAWLSGTPIVMQSAIYGLSLRSWAACHF
jgi:MFS transporter, DHA1 family, multidrug resistance protein